MRISDWSSDVCSSDLPILLILQSRGGEHCKIVSIAEFPPTKIQGICPCTKESLRGLVNHSWQPRETLIVTSLCHLQCLLQLCAVPQLTRKRTHNRFGRFTGAKSPLEDLTKKER